MQKHPETFWEWGGTDVDICAYLNERLSAGESDGVGKVTETAAGDDVAEAALQACWTTVQTQWREAQPLLTELLQASVGAMPEVVRDTERARQRAVRVQTRTQREVDGPPPEAAGASAPGELAAVLRSLSTAERVSRLVRESTVLLQSAAAAERSSARLSTLHESGDLLAYTDALGQLRRALRQLRAIPDLELVTQEWQTRMQSASDTLAERLRQQLQNCVESVDEEALTNDQHTPAERECRQLRACCRRAGMEDRFRDACVGAIVQGVAESSRRRLDDSSAARRLWHSVDEAHVTTREGDHPGRMRWRQVEAAAASRRRALPLDRVPDLQAVATAIAQHLPQVATDLQRYRKWWTALNADIAAGPAAEGTTSNAVTVESPRSASHNTAITSSECRNTRSPTTDDSAADFHEALLLQVAEAVLPSLTALLYFTHAAPPHGQRAADDMEVGTSHSIEAHVTAIFDAIDQWARHVFVHGSGRDIPDDRWRGDATSLLGMTEETSRRPRLADAFDACTLPSLVYASNLGFYFLPELTAPLTAAASNPHAQRWLRVRQQLPRLRALATSLELDGASEVEPTIARALAETARAVDATAEPYGAAARRLARTCAERTGGLALSASVLPALDRAAERLLEEVRQVAALGLAAQRRAWQQLPQATWSASVNEATAVADASPLRSALELLYALASWMECWREARRVAVGASREAARQVWEAEQPHERYGDTASSRTPLSLRWRWHADPDVMATLQALMQADQRPMEAAATAAAVQLADTVQIAHRLVLETLTHGMREQIAALGSAEGAVSAYPSLALMQPETGDDDASGFAVGPSPAAAQLGERLLACAQLLESVLLLAGRGDRLTLAAPLDARHSGDAQHTAELVQQALNMNHPSSAAPTADAALSQAAVARAARPWIGAVSHHVMQCLTERRRRVDSTEEEDPRQLAADLEYLRDVLRALGFPSTTE
ncbi:hypothetical protein CDCA_CDCA12G3537 [Cyanidium caldarium]|uniref:Conserved oligomeric Golgi complex subunit 7 n=1 Tax=Cyanidium caldarium TaxID=2771 RepID=A0AAV9IYV2_CYACA|nr:hypothetical protein CDCA_CDCA12G3537 [Cyanidium caldarium]